MLRYHQLLVCTFILFLISEILSLVAAASSFLLCLTESMIEARDATESRDSEIFVIGASETIGSKYSEILKVHGDVEDIVARSSTPHHNLKPEWTAATPKVRFSYSTNLRVVDNELLFKLLKFNCKMHLKPESSILDHLSKFFLGRKLPDAFHQVLIRVPVTSQHLKTSHQQFSTQIHI